MNSDAAAEPTKGTHVPDREIVSTRSIAFSREQIFGAFRDPKVLAQWWGPKGFKNTFDEFAFRPGGQWRFVMHGPDGKDYTNENVFAEIAEPERIVIDHISWPKFRLTVTLAEQDEKTGITWNMCFESPEVCAQVRPICTEANQENFDRLAATLALDPIADQK